jgi:hypothetical protein
MIISIRDAAKDFLEEAGVTIDDILSQMDEDPKGIDESLRKRIWLDDSSARKLESSLSSRHLNYLIFVLQTFYIINPSGLYKSMFIIPTRESVMRGEKATIEGVQLILKALGIRPIS